MHFVLVKNPVKQGLKLTMVNQLQKLIQSLSEESSKTRIET